MTHDNRGSAGEGEWYRRLVSMHGAGNVLVGPSAHRERPYFWISSTAEEQPTAAEHSAFYATVDSKIAAFRSARIPGGGLLQGPALVGDYFVTRSETLFFGADLFVGKAQVLADLTSCIQCCLRMEAFRQWRVGFFSKSSSLVIYPGAVFVGDRRAETADAFSTRDLDAWIAAMVAEEAALIAHYRRGRDN